jgi:LacI family transcriptional regulator
VPDTRRIALLIETSKAYGRGLLHGISRYAHLHDDWSLYVEERGLDDPIPRWLKPGEFDGVILRARDRSMMYEALERGIPTICLGEDNPPEAHTISNNDALSAVMAADHLLARNFRHFAFVGIKGFVWSDIRRETFTRRVQEAGFEVEILEPAKKTQNLTRWDQISHDLHDWLQGLPKPVGIMACYDVMARAVIDVCHETHLPVPEKVAVIGVDNDEILCEVSQPRLTSVALDTTRIGFEAAVMLDRLIRGEDTSEHVVIPPSGIITRGSTDTLAIEDPHVATALAYIRRRACDGIEAGDVVKQVPLSRRTIERRFRDQAGQSILGEIHKVRLHRMKRFLTETDLKLDAIAHRCGFSHTPYMAAQFRKHFNMTPGEFRQKARAAKQENTQ